MGHKEVYESGASQVIPVEGETVFQARANVAAEAMRTAARKLELVNGLAIVAIWESDSDPVIAYRSLGRFSSETIMGMHGFGAGMRLEGLANENVFIFFEGGGKNRQNILHAGIKALGLSTPE